MYSTKIEIPRLNYNFPSIRELKEFGKKYKDNWKILTDNQEFLSIFTIDLRASEKLAKKILGIKEEKKVNKN